MSDTQKPALRLYAYKYYYDGGCCDTCCDGDSSMTAAWREKPAPYDCIYCGKKTEESVIDHGSLTPPEEPRDATNSEVRSLGWLCEGDDQCEWCGLYEFDGQYPVCGNCNQCSECGHDEGCQIDDAH